MVTAVAQLSLEGPTALKPDSRVVTIGKLNPLALDCIPQLSDGSRTRNHEPSLDLGQMLLRDICSLSKLRLSEPEQSSSRYKLAAKYERFFA